jgi:type II secretory pathway pseudopilin PulG
VQENEKDSPFAAMWWVLMGLCLIFVPLFLYAWHDNRTAGRVSDATAQLMSYQAAINNFNARVGRWPTSLREVETNSSNMVFLNTPNHNDPWSRRYIFVPYNSATGFGRILTYGRDGKPGGTGVDADIERRFP